MYINKEIDIKIKTGLDLFKQMQQVTKSPTGGTYFSIGQSNRKLLINLNRKEYYDFFKRIFNNSQFVNKLEFLNCEFESAFVLNSKTREASLDKVSFEFNFCEINGLTMSETSFAAQLRFKNSNFYRSLYVINSNFKNYLEFFNCIFHKKVRFIRCDFEKTVSLTNSNFKENTFFSYSRFHDIVIFNEANFYKGLDISQAILNNQATFFRTKISNFLSHKQIKNNDVLFEQLLNDGEIPTLNKRETFRVIKEQLLKSQNTIDSLIFERLEKQSHFEFLNETKKWYNGDRIIFFFNEYSNKQKSSFGCGVLFTVISAFLFYFLALITSGQFYLSFDDLNITLQQNIKGFIVFLNPVHSLSILKEIYNIDDFNWQFYLFDYLGRVFVSYGVYQTIQAFRKFR